MLGTAPPISEAMAIAPTNQPSSNCRASLRRKLHQIRLNKASLLKLPEFIYSALRSGEDARLHVSPLLFSAVLRCQDTFPELRASLKQEWRSHALDDNFLFEQASCDAALKTFTQVSTLHCCLTRHEVDNHQLIFLDQTRETINLYTVLAAILQRDV